MCVCACVVCVYVCVSCKWLLYACISLVRMSQNLVHGLNDRPPHVDILTRPFDTALPAIDAASVDADGLSVSPVHSDGEEGSLDTPAARSDDEYAPEAVLRIQLENARLKAQLASITALCADVESGISIKRASRAGAATSSPNAEAGGKLRHASLAICEQAAALTLASEGSHVSRHATALFSLHYF